MSNIGTKLLRLFTDEEVKAAQKALKAGPDVKRIGDAINPDEVIEGTPTRAKKQDVIDAEYDPLLIDRTARTPDEVKQYNETSLIDALNKNKTKGLAGAGLLYSDSTGSVPPKETESESPAGPTGSGSTKITSTTTKPKETSTISLPESEEAKLIESRLNNLNLQYAELKDPPMTSDVLRKQMADDLKKVRENKETTYLWAQLAERFLAAATKFGAAKEGLARNLDMSNAEVERTDWDKLTERAYIRYKEDVQDLVNKLDKEDKAKAQVDALKVRQDELRTSLKQNLAKLQDARASELRRLEERRQDRAAKAKESGLDRDLRLKIAEIKKTQSPEQVQGFVSEFTNDPATAKELYAAALLGDSAFKSALTRSGVADKLKPEALDKYSKESWFGLGERKLNVGDARGAVLSPKQAESTEKKAGPYGNRVSQNGVNYIWNGAEYIPE